MTEQTFILILIPTVMIIGFVLGITASHIATMRGIAHVQPSTKEMVKNLKGATVTHEVDPWEMAEKEDDKKTLEERFKETGLPREQFNPKDFFGYDNIAEEGAKNGT